MTAISHALVVLLALALLLFEYRALRRCSSSAASMFGLGLAARGIVGSLLVIISLFGLPILRSLQLGNGFWLLAPDAQVYFHQAANAAADLSTIGSATPSPTYVRALAVWFRSAGASPATAVLFNLLCFAAAASLLARRPREEGALANTPLFAVTFAPLLVLSSTQVLKDGFFTVLVVTVFVAAASLYQQPPAPRGVGRTALDTIILAVALGFLAGIRAYYALILWLALAVAALVDAARYPARRLNTAARSGAVLVVLWIAFAVGAADYYAYYSDLSARVTGIHFPRITRLQSTSGATTFDDERGLAGMTGTLVRLRGGFVASGGATSLARFGGRRIADVAFDTAFGLLAIFVPISILKWTALVEFSGGRGFLFLTDLDTLFMDVMIGLAVFHLIRRERRLHTNLPFVSCAAFTATVSTLLLAYVVTNFGTLVRLRTMGAMPIWFLPLAISSSVSKAAAEKEKGPDTGPLQPRL